MTDGADASMTPRVPIIAHALIIAHKSKKARSPSREGMSAGALGRWTEENPAHHIEM